ncbi:MAG: hypothetical protein RLZZ437_2940 [Pseudomonadota bacterium]|jgi:hypothetical protein
MKRLIPLIFLAACGAQPTPAMFGAERFEATRDGRQYVVFLKDNAVEVIRLGYATRGEHAGIRATMLALVPEVTGCKLNENSVVGDSGEIRGSVRC